VSIFNFMGGSLGVGAFAGVGGAASTRINGVLSNPALTVVPVGATVGYRHSIGTSKGFSVFASPIYRWTRADSSGFVESSSAMRGAIGLDFAVTQSIGFTVGGEFGAHSATSESGLFGVAISFLPGRL
jgi:hypothetical protein